MGKRGLLHGQKRSFSGYKDASFRTVAVKHKSTTRVLIILCQIAANGKKAGHTDEKQAVPDSLHSVC